MRVLLVGLALLLANPASALVPLPGPAPDWRQAKRDALAAYDRIEAAYPDQSRYPGADIHRILSQVRDLADRVENNDRVDRDRKLLFVRDHGIPGQDPGEISQRLRWMHDAHMEYLYASLLPRIVNEGFADSAKSLDLPGYPLTVAFTQDDYCSRYEPVDSELADLLSAQSPAFPPGGRGFCAAPK